jgi:hypothetical protein
MAVKKPIIPKIKEDSNLEAIREKLKNPDNIKPDDPRVLIAEMQINALKELANNDNRIFSQISNGERWDVARCLTFWADALPAVSHRLEKLGINKTFNSEIVPMVISEHLSLGHLVDRGRVTEYIDGLNAVAPKQGMMMPEEGQKRTLMSRMI